MSCAVGFALRHKVSFVHFMEEKVSTLSFVRSIINPDFILGYKFVDMMVTASRKVEIKSAAYQPPVDNPYTDSVLQFFPEVFVNARRIGKCLPRWHQFLHIP